MQNDTSFEQQIEARILTGFKAVETLTSVDSHILRKFSETVQIFFSSPTVTIPTTWRKCMFSRGQREKMELVQIKPKQVPLYVTLQQKDSSSASLPGNNREQHCKWQSQPLWALSKVKHVQFELTPASCARFSVAASHGFGPVTGGRDSCFGSEVPDRSEVWTSIYSAGTQPLLVYKSIVPKGDVFLC